MYLSRFSFYIEHIDGIKNVLVDIITRWVRGYRVERDRSQGKDLALTGQDMKIVPSADEIEWPTLQLIKEEQYYIQNIPLDASLDPEGLILMNENVWIPRDSSELILKILVSSNCGSLGHRGPSATLSILRERFYWKGMENSASMFLTDAYIE